MMLFILTTFLAALVLVPGGQTNAIAIRNRKLVDNCLTNCRSNFGWPGHLFSNDPWGLVMDPNLMSSSSTSSSSSVVAVSTSLLNSIGAAGVESAPSSHSPILATTASPSPSFAPNTSSSVSSSSTTTHSSANKAPAFNVALPTSSTPKLTSSSPPPPPPSPKTSAPPPPPPPPPSPSPSPSPSPAPTSSGNSDKGSGSTSGPTSQSDIQAYLDGHNNVRAQHGATALTYSQDLAAKAQQWANGCIFKHSGGTLGPFGENIAAGTGDGYGISQALQSWTDEVSQYNPGNPVPSHFTQVVWKATTQVGCALQDCDGIFPGTPGKAHFYVCEYSPQGNVIGEFGANVQA